MEELNFWIVAQVEAYPLATGYVVFFLGASLLMLSVYLAFGGARKIISNRAARVRALLTKIDMLERQGVEAEKEINEARQELLEIENEIEQKLVVKESNTLALANKINELYILREKELISAPQMSELLAELVSNAARNIDIEKALTSLKQLEEQSFIDSQGYERVSGVLVQMYFGPETGIRGKLKKYARNVGL